MRRAKIVATLGPALDDPARLREAIEAGIDVVRLNFSHGTVDEHVRRHKMVREIADEVGCNVGTIGDLQGVKIRLGDLPEGGVEVADGDEVRLVPDDGTAGGADDDGLVTLPVSYQELAEDAQPGALVLIDDGLIRLVVSRVGEGELLTRVVSGGTVKSRKGVNLPDVDVSVSPLTDKDREDVATMVDLGIDWVALSFVRQPDDVREVRRLIKEHGGQAPVIAKLERPEAIDNLDEIVRATDAVMVARGDLGVEVGPERVPAMQKEIIDRANIEARPVITATEMLESMMRNPRPTRAEASDVANAVFDGTDAVMLSGETAVGRYPVEAVRTMARIIEVAETSQERVHVPPPPSEGIGLARTVARAAVQVARDLDARALCVFSLSGNSAQLVSKFRPSVPLVGLTPHDASARRIALMWGAEAVIVPEKDHSRDLTLAAEAVCLEDSYGREGEVVVIVSGVPGGHGGTNRLIVHRLGEAAA